MLAMVVCFVLIGILTACGQAAEELAAEPTNAQNAAVEATTDANPVAADITEETVHIRIMSWHGPDSPTQHYQGYRDIADAYNAINPHVTFEFVFQPLEGYRELLDTQFIAGTATEIIHMQPAMVRDYANLEVLYNLNIALNSPSAWNDTAPTWMDTFYGGEESFSARRALNRFGGIFFIPSDGNPALAIGQPIAFNKRLFEQAGLDPSQTPGSWEEFLVVLNALKDSGVIPIAADSSRFVGWSMGNIGVQFGEFYVDQFFDDRFNGSEMGDLFADKLRVALANGWMNRPSYYYDFLNIWRDFTDFWQPGWTGTVDVSAAEQLFFMEQAAMIQIGSWSHSFFVDTIGDDFEWSVFAFPFIDTTTSPHGIGVYAAPAGQQDYGFALNQTIADNPYLRDTVIDFMQFFTSVPMQIEYTNTAQAFSPIIGVPVLDVLMAYAFPPDRAIGSNQVVGARFIEWADGAVWPGHATEFLLGLTDVEEFLERISDSVIENNQRWVTDMLSDTGYIQQITESEEMLATMVAAGAAPVAIASQERAIEVLRTRLEILETYFAP